MPTAQDPSYPKPSNASLVRTVATVPDKRARKTSVSVRQARCLIRQPEIFTKKGDQSPGTCTKVIKVLFISHFYLLALDVQSP